MVSRAVFGGCHPVGEGDGERNTSINHAIPAAIDPARLLEEQLDQTSPDLVRELLGCFINTLMSAEADAVCAAEYGTVSPKWVNRRNGDRHRGFDTRTARSMSRFRCCGRALTS